MAGWSGVYQGISGEEAERRVVEYGENVLAREQQFSVVRLLISQFTSPMIYILLAAMGITLVLGDYVDAAVIGLAVVVNTILGFWQEYKAEQSLAALASVLSPEVMVLRDGKRVKVEATEIVPGDVVFLESGDKVPADGVLVEAHDLQVSEAVLTGESIPIDKQAVKLGDGSDVLGQLQKMFQPLESRKGESEASVYSGSAVQRGAGVMMVLATGSETEIGGIADALAATEDEETPLQKKLADLSRKLAWLVGILVVALVVVGVLTGVDLMEIFKLSVAIAVSAIPEGLVVSLTAILAIGMQRILRRKALVRKLVAAEVLGSVTVIATDKTGTITEGVLKVSSAVLEDEQLGMAALVSASDLKDPMEVAMYEWAEAELGDVKLEGVKKAYQRLDRMPFSSEKKFSATLTEKELFVVGAPEVLLQQSSLAQKELTRWREEINKQAAKGYRLVGVAHRKSGKGRSITDSMLDKKLNWLGYVVYEDQVRKGLTDVFKTTKKAGIGVKVITGDYKETAVEVMRQIGLSVNEDEIMLGSELEKIDDHALDQRIAGIKLFARTSPTQKLKIVNSLQRSGEVVAMSGDGVNDAPALKKADIGLVVSGASDVSKETADMVLLDDNFETIIAAVEEGRGIFANLRKVLVYLLSDSFSGITAIVGAMLLGLPLPILPAQILWINLVNDGFPTLALTVDPKDDDLLEQTPRSTKDPLIDREVAFFIVIVSLVTGGFMLMSFVWLYVVQGLNLEYARTFVFALSCADSLMYVYALRSLRYPVWQHQKQNLWLIAAVVIGYGFLLAAIYLPPLQTLLGTVPLSLRDLLMVMAISALVVVIIEISKWVYGRWLADSES